MTTESIAVSNNQPAELFVAQAKIARLEATVAQADYMLAEALESSAGYDDMLQKMQMVQKTLKEALGQDRELMRLA